MKVLGLAARTSIKIFHLAVWRGPLPSTQLQLQCYFVGRWIITGEKRFSPFFQPLLDALILLDALDDCLRRLGVLSLYAQRKAPIPCWCLDLRAGIVGSRDIIRVRVLHRPPGGHRLGSLPAAQR